MWYINRRFIFDLCYNCQYLLNFFKIVSKNDCVINISNIYYCYTPNGCWASAQNLRKLPLWIIFGTSCSIILRSVVLVGSKAAAKSINRISSSELPIFEAISLLESILLRSAFYNFISLFSRGNAKIFPRMPNSSIIINVHMIQRVVLNWLAPSSL